jgi:hypothetical protein
MGFALPNGSTVFVGSGLGSPVSVSTVSNAEGAVFTVAENHNLKVDDVVLISSGWGVIDGLVARITAQTTNSVTISVINSSDRNFFPAHAGGGKLQKITEWTEIPQITKSRSRVVNSSMHRYSFWQTIASVILAPLRRLKAKPLP